MSSLHRFPQRAGTAAVTARDRLAARMIRLTLRAGDFGPQWPVQQPGEIITLLFPAEGDEIVLPEQGWRFPADTPEQPWRNYTVRAHRPDLQEIDVDVLLHEPRGPACVQAAAARLGDRVGYAGPRVDYAPVDGAEWLLLCGDETALPSIAATLESAPDELPVIAIIEVADAGDEVQIAARPSQRVVWVHRGDQPAGTGTVLADAVRQVALPSGAGQAWGAAESRVARDLRTVLREELGMDRARARARGYWLRTGEWLDDEA